MLVVDLYVYSDNLLHFYNNSGFSKICYLVKTYVQFLSINLLLLLHQ